MRLNGIYAEPGTIIGIDFRSKRFLAVDFVESYSMDPECVLRFATAEEVRPQSFKHEPRSVVEHQGIPRRASVYGIIRQFRPTPVKAVKIEIPFSQSGPSRRIRRAAKFYRNR